MKITILNENNSRIDNYLLAEPAFSALIECDNKKILFDTGYSDVFLKNAETMGINLNNITDIVISHGHDDHTGGLQYYKPISKKIDLIAHPNIFDKKIDEIGNDYGCPLTFEQLKQHYNLNLTKKPLYLTKNLLFLGEIENNYSDDIDDSALVYIMNDKLFIITGCSHSGIINIVNYAKKVTNITEIYGILGGFHLIDKSDEDINNISKFLKNEKIELIAPCHCCDLHSKVILAKSNVIKEVCVGDIFELN